MIPTSTVLVIYLRDIFWCATNRWTVYLLPRHDMEVVN